MSQVVRRYGKPLDVRRLKSPVLADLAGHVTQVARMAEYLRQHERQVAQESCYVCDGVAREPVAAIHGFEYVRCTACSHVYTTHRYDDDAIERFYRRNEYYARITYANRESCEYRREAVARPKVAFAEEHIGPPPGRWLDVGSGIGDIASVLDGNGWDVTGLELSATSVTFARDVFGITLLPETLDGFVRRGGIQPGQADVVSFFAILEHVTDPMAMLRRSFELLRPGGHLVVQVPNARSLSTFVQQVFPEHVFRHMSPVSHIMVFTEPSLTTALRLAGFEIAALWFLGLDVYELLNTLVLQNPRVQGSRLQETLLTHMEALQHVLDREELSDGIIAVARRQESRPD